MAGIMVSLTTTTIGTRLRTSHVTPCTSLTVRLLAGAMRAADKRRFGMASRLKATAISANMVHPNLFHRRVTFFVHGL